MRLLLQSSRRFLHRHPGQLLLAVVGIAAGVAVVTGVALMRDVLIHSLDLAAEELTGRDSLRIEHPAGRLSEQVFTELATAEGAPDLMPVISVRARTDGRILELIAIDPLAAGAGGVLPLAGADLNALMRTPGGVAASPDTLDRLGLERGNRFRAHVAGASHELTVASVLGRSRAFDDRLLMDIAVAQDLLGWHGEISWIEAPADSRAWLERHLPPALEMTEAQQRRDSAARLTAGMRANLSAMSLLSLAVGLFVIYSVLSFLLVQRRHSFGMLRAVGVTRGRIGGVLAIETLLLSSLGALLGLVLGTLLAGQLLELVRQPVAELYRLLPPARVQPDVVLYLAVFVAAVVLAQLSTATVWLEARRIPPGRMVQAAPENRPARLLPLIACLALIAAVLIIGLSQSLPAALAGLFFGLAGCALLAPAAGLRLLGLLRLPARRKLVGRALAMLAAGRERISPAISALSLALALSAGIAMMVMGFRATVDDWIDRLLRADVYLTLSQGQIDDALVSAVSGMDTIDSISSARRTRLADGRTLVAYGLTDAAWAGFELLAGSGDAARRQFFDGTAVLISEPFARHHDLEVGETIDLPAPERTLSLPIAAVFRDYASDQGVIAIDGETYRRHWNDPVRDSLGLYLQTDEAGDELRHALAGVNEHIVLTGREEVRRQTLAVFDRTFRISWALAVLVGLIAAIALISALLAQGLERRREYATLRALGLTRRGLAGVVMAQTTGMALAAAVVAIPLALAIHAAVSGVVQPRAFGWTLPMTWPMLPLAVMLPLAILAGLVAGIYPGWKIARRAPAPELR